MRRRLVAGHVPAAVQGDFPGIAGRVVDDEAVNGIHRILVKNFQALVAGLFVRQHFGTDHAVADVAVRGRAVGREMPGPIPEQAGRRGRTARRRVELQNIRVITRRAPGRRRCGRRIAFRAGARFMHHLGLMVELLLFDADAIEDSRADVPAEAIGKIIGPKPGVHFGIDKESDPLPRAADEIVNQKLEKRGVFDGFRRRIGARKVGRRDGFVVNRSGNVADPAAHESPSPTSLSAK